MLELPSDDESGHGGISSTAFDKGTHRRCCTCCYLNLTLCLRNSFLDESLHPKKEGLSRPRGLLVRADRLTLVSLFV